MKRSGGRRSGGELGEWRDGKRSRENGWVEAAGGLMNELEDTGGGWRWGGGSGGGVGEGEREGGGDKMFYFRYI